MFTLDCAHDVAGFKVGGKRGGKRGGFELSPHFLMYRLLITTQWGVFKEHLKYLYVYHKGLVGHEGNNDVKREGVSVCFEPFFFHLFEQCSPPFVQFRKAR